MSQENVHRVYLHEEWYLNVDDSGYLIGPCAEGALGYVLQLQSADYVSPEKEFHALKIPRLRADTIEENAHIVRTLKDEALAVRDANRADQQKLKDERETQRAVEGLITTAITKTDGFIRGPRSLANNGIDADALPQHQCIPFLSFSKDHRLRICNVRYDFPANEKPRLVTFPNTPSVAEALSFLTPKLWQKYFQGRLPPGLEGTVYFETATFSAELAAAESSAQGGNQEDISGEQTTMAPMKYRNHGKLDGALTLEHPMVTWYAGVPSIVFHWSTGTLQRAISTNAHRGWKLEHHYALVRQVLRGLKTLHHAGIIHADVRPANIMVQGSLSNPEHFKLSDYGSFANDQAGSGTGGGHTTAPGVVRHRTSVFYSRERRAGIEREDADVAIIIGNTGATRDFYPGYYVRLGWKAELVEPTRGDVRTEVLEDMVKCWQRLEKERRDSESGRTSESPVQSPHGTAWSLASGDLFRVRDYVFRIREIPQTAHSIPAPARESAVTPQPARCNDFLCESTYTCVLLEKLSVRRGRDLFEEVIKKEDVKASGATDGRPAVILLDLPRWVEIRQSSVASDIYSVGVTALYSVYTAALNRKRAIGKPSEDTQNGQDAPIDIEERVATMLRRLEDEANFNQLWSELDHVCLMIEEHVKQPTHIDDLLRKDIAPQQDPAVQSAAVTSKLEFGQVACNLLQTIVGLSSELDDIALYGCQNYGHFLLFMHFVLSCIHRKSHRINHQTRGKVREEFPFCKDRFEKGTKDEVASAVLSRLEKLHGYFQHPVLFDGLHRHLEHTDFTAARQSDFKLRQQVYELVNEGKRADRAEKDLEEARLKYEAQMLEMDTAKTRLQATLDAEKRYRLQYEQTSAERLLATLRLLNELESYGGRPVFFDRRLDESMLDRLRKEIEGLSSIISVRNTAHLSRY